MSSQSPPVAGDFVRGIAFAGVTTLLWGLLPVLMDVALRSFQSGTIVWFRFLFAFVCLFIFLSWRREQPSALLLRPPPLGLLAGMCLAGNYYFFLEGIRLSSPSNTGVIIQIAPVLVVLAGVFVFKERFNRAQAAGLGVAVLGFSLFFIEQSGAAPDVRQYRLADAIIVLAGVAWALFMTLQKHLQIRFRSQHLNLLVYASAGVTLTVTADFAELGGASSGGWGLLMLLGLNTLIAYGCLAEAVRYIPLSLISVIVALNPFITMVLMQLVPQVFPGWVRPETITVTGYLGAAIAIGGVIVVIGQYEKAG